VLAEDFALDNGLAKPNGRSIGYELATTSAWGRVKGKVYDPVVQVLTNAAAMAVMLIFPPSAAVIVPMLALTGIVNNVDHMVSNHDKGKLTFQNASIDLLAIGLSVLPALRGAKLLNPAKSAIEEVKGLVNMRLMLFDAVQIGGQFIVMAEQTQEQLVEIQDKQISAMAEKYRALIDLQKQVHEKKLNESDPRLRQMQADIEADAQAIRDTVITTWSQAVLHQAAFFIGPHLVGGHEEAAAGANANRNTHFEPHVPREVTGLRKTAANTFETDAPSLRVVHAHYEGEGVQTSAITYDHEAGTAHFEITDKSTGTKTRIEAPINGDNSVGEPHGAQNKAAGRPVSSPTNKPSDAVINRSREAGQPADRSVPDAANGARAIAQTGQQMEPIEQGGVQFEPAATAGLTEVRNREAPTEPLSSTQEVKNVVESLPTLDVIHEVAGVEKGPAYALRMAELRDFYAQMDVEGRKSQTRNQGQAVDGAYRWDYGHDAFAFSHGLATFEVRVYLDTSGVSPTDAAHLRQQVYAGIDHHYNAKKFLIQGPDGKARQMHLEVYFVDDPSVSHLKVTAHPRNGIADLFNWFVGGNQTTHAHEITHGAFGIKDEYWDDTGWVPDRSTPQSPGVRTDQSIMGNYWIGHPIIDNHADPATTVKQRHVDEIGRFSPPAPNSETRQQQQTQQEPGPAQQQTRTQDGTKTPSAPAHSPKLEKVAHELGVTLDQLEGTLSLISDRDVQMAARIRRRLIDGHPPLSKSDRSELNNKLAKTKHASAFSHEGAMARIAEFRRSANLPAYNPDVEATGTVAMAVVGGQEFFGVNSKFSPDSVTMRKETLARIHAEGHGEGVGTLLHRARELTHAEAHALMLAYNQLGDLRGTVVVHVDRTTCNFCSAEKSAVAALQRLYGIDELVIIDGDGRRWTFPRGKEQ